jgi:hypothetical protein
MREEVLANGERRTYSIVILSDGENQNDDGWTQSRVEAMLPSGLESDQVHVYTIAYGTQTNEAFLQLLSNRTNGKFFESSTEDIGEIYFLISSEF